MAGEGASVGGGLQCHLLPVFLLSLANQLPGLSVHDRGPGPSLLPAVVVFHQAGDQLIRNLQGNNQTVLSGKYLI